MACGNLQISGSTRGLALLPRLPSTVRSHSVIALSSRKAQEVMLDRRRALEVAVVGVVGLINSPLIACAEEDVGLETYYGLATPPTSYGGYGGNANEDPKYSFSYPANWKITAVNKVQKGTQGIDCIITSPRNKNMRVFVIALGRAGEDDKSFKLTDVDSTFAGFAGADYNLQDALVSSTGTKKGKREVDGRQFYDYDITSPDTRYLSTITVKDGKVFAFFIKSPTKQFEAMEGVFKTMLNSFKTL